MIVNDYLPELKLDRGVMYGESCHYGLKIAAIKAPQGFVERGYRKRVEHIYEGGSWTIIDSEEPLGVNLNIKPEL